MTRIPHRLLLLGILAALGVGACVSPAPLVERELGKAVLAARAQQTVNPDASRNTDPVAGLNGRAAASAINRYYESNKAPAAPTNVFNIGLGGS